MEEGEGEVYATVLNGSKREVNSQSRLESVDGAEAELYVRKQANEVCIDSEIKPVVACLAMEICNESELGTSSTEREERELVLDNTRLNSSHSDIETKKVSKNREILQPSAVESNVMDVASLTELKPCSETQWREDMEHDELEPGTETHEMEVLNSTELESFAESKKNKASDEHFVKILAEETLNVDEVETEQVVNDSEMYTCSNKNHAVEEPDRGDMELFCARNEVAEAPNDFMLEPCPVEKVEEASNEDVYSEVSNPNLSPKHVTSSLTISSQPLDVLGGDQGGFGEITSACSQNSSADGSFCKEKLSKNYRLESVSTSRVELEIPKHVSTTGIRKITFKFSKRKEDYDSPISVTGKPMLINDFHEDHNDKQLCASATQHLTGNDFQNKAYDAFEAGGTNAATNLIMNGNEFHGPQSPFSCAPNRELKMSKKIVPHNYPTNVKKLLSTRILEGARVKYISVSGEKEIPGIIKDSGYLCGCGLCNFSKVVSAYEFELHAGTKTRHPNNHIYMENGRPIYSIIQELRTAPLSTLDDVLKAVAGSSINEEYYQVWKANLQYGNSVSYADGVYQSNHFSTDVSITGYSSQPIEDSTFPASCHYPIIPYNQQSYIEAPMDQRCLHKKPRHNLYSSVLEQKKTTKSGAKKRDNDLHKLLFMPNGLPDGTDLAYYAKGKRILGGYKQGNGIVCSCCNTELSPSQFEAHAGWSAKRQPYRHIYTSSGLTLHDIALMLANGQNIVTGGSDDMCAVCGDGGELIICNGCPRAFHADCLGLQSLPADDWHCPHCTDNFGSGRKTARESRPIILRLTRVVKAPEIETGGCIICRSQDFSAAKFDDLTVILCDQCEKEYHVGCLRERGMCDLKELPKDKWFCCDDCDKIFSTLQILASSGPEVIPTSVSAAICRKHAAIGLKDESNNVIQWRLLSGKSRFPEHLVLLSQAAAIFRECFDPIVATSGRDLIPVMVYGRNISGQEFSGMYCIVLIVNSVVVSAALLRIFGQEAAELPLVATSRESQGKGYFQALFSCIERLLSSMNVKHLVLPAAEEAEPMWTKKLGFTKTSHEQMLKYTRDLQLTIFKGTSLLEKGVQQLAD